MTVDTTVAGADSNSYLDVAGADALAASELGGNAKAWRAATIEDKEAALIRATAEIDEFVGAPPRAVVAGPPYTRRPFVASGLAPYAPDQGLTFPRAYDLDPTDEPIIPARIARATFLQAAYLIVNADLIDEAGSRRARGLTSFSNPDATGGTISDKRDFGRLHPRVEALLGDVAGGAVVGWIETD